MLLNNFSSLKKKTSNLGKTFKSDAYVNFDVFSFNLYEFNKF